MYQDFLSNIPGPILERTSGGLHFELESKLGSSAVGNLLGDTVLNGGKRLRPLLTYVLGNLFGLEVGQLDPFARAIEMVHAASLAHDDVVDEATTRRGRPSINALAGNKKAVLAGDFLLADVIVGLAETGELRLVQEMSFVIQELALGEWIQWDAANDRLYTREIIEEIARKKTSSVMSWCAVAPAVLARLGADQVARARRFGIHLGLAFQQMDDTLDFSSDGLKDQHLDLKNGVVNSVVFEWLSLNSLQMERFRSGQGLESLIAELDQAALSRPIEVVKERAHKNLEEAKRALTEIEEAWDFSRAGERLRFDKALEVIDSILFYLAHRSH